MSSSTTQPYMPPLDTQTISNDPILGSKIPSSPDNPRRRERAMSATSEWKPDIARRQSWSSQEYLHEFHQKLAQDHEHGSPGQGQGGFTERG
ncbi:hypothetical protein QBC44DRAFT_371044 [Cladorrhinum sp. PSN332]|nr:hypothetical protein QBC44DRAFT_371044 [Cladorrhinum sp. PSN332]